MSMNLFNEIEATEENKEETKETVLKEIYSKEYNFRYFITLDYHYKCKDFNKVLSDNKRLKTSTNTNNAYLISCTCFYMFFAMWLEGRPVEKGGKDRVNPIPQRL